MQQAQYFVAGQAARVIGAMPQMAKANARGCPVVGLAYPRFPPWFSPKNIPAIISSTGPQFDESITKLERIGSGQ